MVPQTRNGRDGFSDQHSLRSHQSQTEKEVNIGSRKTRGPTYMRDIWARNGEEERIKVDFNKRGQPVGETKKKFTEFLGTVARNGRFAPLDVKDWHTMPLSKKKEILDVVKEKFILPPSIDRWTLQSVGKKWRNWKSRVKANYDENLSVEQQLHKKPKRVLEEQWKNLLIYWKIQKVTNISNQNKKNSQTKKMIHSTGKYSFAEMIEKKEKELGHSPSRAELFDACYSKNGQPSGKEVHEILVPSTRTKKRKTIHVSEMPASAKTPKDTTLELIGPAGSTVPSSEPRVASRTVITRSVKAKTQLTAENCSAWKLIDEARHISSDGDAEVDEDESGEKSDVPLSKIHSLTPNKVHMETLETPSKPSALMSYDALIAMIDIELSSAQALSSPAGRTISTGSASFASARPAPSRQDLRTAAAKVEYLLLLPSSKLFTKYNVNLLKAQAAILSKHPDHPNGHELEDALYKLAQCYPGYGNATVTLQNYQTAQDTFEKTTANLGQIKQQVATLSTEKKELEGRKLALKDKIRALKEALAQTDEKLNELDEIFHKTSKECAHELDKLNTLKEAVPTMAEAKELANVTKLSAEQSAQALLGRVKDFLGQVDAAIRAEPPLAIWSTSAEFGEEAEDSQAVDSALEKPEDEEKENNSANYEVY